MAGKEPCNEDVTPARQQVKALGGRVGHACAAHGSWEAVQLDRELLKAEVRPDVREDIRLQADEETRLLLANLKACLPDPLLLHMYISMHVSIAGVSAASAHKCGRRPSGTTAKPEPSRHIWQQCILHLQAHHSLSAGSCARLMVQDSTRRLYCQAGDAGA